MNSSTSKDLDKVIEFCAQSIKGSKLYENRSSIRKEQSKLRPLLAKAKKTEKEVKNIEKIEKQLANLNHEKNIAEKIALNEDVPSWLDKAAEKGITTIKKEKRSTKATHVLKYTDGYAYHFSICVDDRGNTTKYLTTETLSEYSYDIAHSNGAYITESLFFQVELTNGLIIDKVLGEDFQFLKHFTKDEKRLERWIQGLSAWVAKESCLTASLAKQLYFPTSADYHILAPLFASSLSNSLSKRVNGIRFSEANLSAGKRRRDGKYSKDIHISYPELALVHFGGEHPRNISAINHTMRGNSLFLSCKPPEWRDSLQLPISKYAFWRNYQRRAYKTANTMAKFLKGVKDYNNKKIRDTRQQFTDELIDKLFSCAAEIRSVKVHAGWSVESNISEAEKFWLDQYREDQEFVEARTATNWNEGIALQFAIWLNRQLKRNGLNVADVELQKWSDDLQKKLAQDLRGFEL